VGLRRSPIRTTESISLFELLMSNPSTPLYTSTPSSSASEIRSILRKGETRYVNFDRRRKVAFHRMAGRDKEGEGPGGENPPDYEKAKEVFEDQEVINEFVNIADENKKTRFFLAGWRILKCALEDAENFRKECTIIGGRVAAGEEVDFLAKVVREQIKAHTASTQRTEQSPFDNLMNSMVLEEPPNDDYRRIEDREKDHQTGKPTKIKARRSYGAKIRDDDSDDDEELVTRSRKPSDNYRPFSSFNPQQPTFQQGPMTVSFIQQKAIKSFDGLPTADPSRFLKDYEKMATSWSEKAKVDNLGQYLEGAASDWLEILENELKEELTYDDQGKKSNRWLDLKWSQLKRLFEKEYLTEKVQELLACRQGPDETGVTYFYRACRMHSNSGIGLEESPLIKFIVDHMSPQYLDAFRYRNFNKMKDLKQAIILFDQRRSDELAKKREGKRKSAAIAFLEADEKRAKVETGETEKAPATEDFLAKIAAIMEQSQQQQRAAITCYRCGKIGHIARNCRLPQNPQGNSSFRGSYRGGRGGRGRGGRGGFGNTIQREDNQQQAAIMPKGESESPSKPENQNKQ
jgi:hypothetical protein